ncbi:hypothetical protein BD408DRAFT_333885, partial [Parasitella parasitica]
QKRAPIFTIILKPHNASFQTRTLEFKDKAKMRIGRQTSSKTAPTAFNGYFDSKVLSRQHAEIWCDKAKDIKSSNGTFVNKERLSNEGEESEPRELHDLDEIEFGIDILDDNGAIMYHKVSCSVHIPLSQADDGIIKEPSSNDHVQVYPDPHVKYLDIPYVLLVIDFPAAAASGKRSKKLEAVLTKLQSEIEKSRYVENELRTIKGTITDLDKVFSEDRLRKADELQSRLNQAETTIKSYDSKWKHQNQAIQAAKNELHRLEKELSISNVCRSERDKIKQELSDERQRVKELETRLE